MRKMKRGRPVTKFDVDVSGSSGFFALQAMTTKAREWMQRVQGFDGHSAYSDDTRMTQEIAEAAHAEGLRVSVNSREYLGAGMARRAK